MSKENNLKDFLTDLHEGIASKKPDASRNPQNFRSEIESIVSIPDGYIKPEGSVTITGNSTVDVTDKSEVVVNVPDNPKPTSVSDEAELLALLETSQSGSVYLFIGTSDTYKKGYYIILTEEKSGEPYYKYLPLTAGTLEITENGEYDVEEKLKVNVNVESSSAIPQEITSETEMTALLESAPIGAVYKYTGTSGTYENGVKYEVTDGSEGEGGGSANLPLAYTVSSVDELPSDAVDGSMAIVQYESDTRGTWVLSDELVFDDTLYIEMEFEVVGSTEKYKTMLYNSFGPGAPTIAYKREDNNTIRVYTGENGYGISTGWSMEDYKTIKIIKLSNENDIAFIKANGVLIERATIKAFYLYENGEWVYKGEVA